jgi:fructokinase
VTAASHSAPTLRIGIDVGGTKIEAIALEGARELARVRVPTPRNDYDATLDAIVRLVDDVERRAGTRGSIGIGIPGTLSPEQHVVKNANSTWLIGRHMQADLESRLGRPVRIANDANCFAISEATDGAATGAAVVFGVIVGTGTGAGIVVNGHVVGGANAIAGEWGHNPLPWPEPDEWPGPPCYCGRTGCIETFLSGPGLVADHALHTGRRLEPDDIAAAAQNDEPEALASLQRYERRMARALASIINALDPDVIVLGGGMSNIARLYDTVPRLWRSYVFSRGAEQEMLRTRLVRAVHGDSSGVRGAAWLWNS